jgi:metal iron transporter
MAFDGFIPSKYVFGPGALYACKLQSFSCKNFFFHVQLTIAAVGIIGATVMPHSLYIGSALATQNRISPAPKLVAYPLVTTSRESLKDSIEIATSFRAPLPKYQRIIHATRDFLVTPFRTPPPSAYSARAQRYEDRENNTFDFVRLHIYHGMVDMVVSLLGFAVVINALLVFLILLSEILILNNVGI